MHRCKSTLQTSLYSCKHLKRVKGKINQIKKNLHKGNTKLLNLNLHDKTKNKHFFLIFEFSQERCKTHTCLDLFPYNAPTSRFEHIFNF